MFEGCPTPIIAELTQAGLAEHAAYFQTHLARLDYATFAEAGLPIGSGAVESEVKQFKARMTGAGMRWSRPGADHMLLVRAAVLDGSFDRRWDLAA